MSKKIAAVDADEVLKNRAEYFDAHPLLVGKQILPTPLLLRLLATVKPLVLLRATGCWLSGPSGIGKSSAETFLEAWLPKCSPLIQVVRYNGQTQSQLSVRGFHQRMLIALKVARLSGETIPLRDRVQNALLERARRNRKPLIVLLIDEGQAMNVGEFYFLKDLGNDFAPTEAQIVTIMMGQEPGTSQFVEELKLDVKSRFGLRRLLFPAYSTVEDFAGLLGAIDRAVYPQNTDLTWTRFFLPQAYDAGFRLEGQAANLVSALRAIVGGKARIYPVREVMQGVRFLVSTTLAAIDGPQMKVPEDAWKKALEFGMVREACELIGDDFSWGLQS